MSLGPMAMAVAVALVAACASVGGAVGAASGSPVPLIIDTDIGGGGCMDVDDVAAICMAHALADNGEADILAIVQNTSPQHCAGVISVLNHYYGRDDVPIGAYKGNDLDPNAHFLPYVTELVTNFPSPIKNSSQVPNSVQVYRKALAAAEDRSVAISSIGLLTNLQALLQSGPDQYSNLTGPDLMAQKVKLLAVMGGRYPSSGSIPECNLCGCYNGASSGDSFTSSLSSAYVFSHLPPEVQVIFSGFNVGFHVQSGAVLSQCAPVENPCRAAFINYEGGPNRSRYSWDPLTTLIAVRGVQAGSCSECTNCSGVNAVDARTGNNEWVPGPKSNESYIMLDDGAAAGASIDKLLCQQPKHLASRRRS